jgi:integrase
MPTANLKNGAAVAALELPAGTSDVFYWDNEIEKYCVRVRKLKSGAISRTHILQYRNVEGVSRKYNIGDVDSISIGQARDKARKLVASITLGADPQGEKEAKREARREEAARKTFDQGVALYLAAKGEEMRPSSLKSATLYLTGKYFPFGKKPLDDVTRANVAESLDAISKAPTREQARAGLNSFYVWAIERGHCSTNPVIGTSKPKNNSERDRVLSADELKQVWNACDGSDDYSKIIRLLVLTGCRRDEIGGLRWSEVNLDEGTITIAAERCKNGRAHTLSLPALALDIIRSVTRHDDRDHLFGSKGEGFTMWSHSKKRLDAACGVTAWRVHDTRRSVSTGMGELGIEPHYIEAILNHVSGHKAGVAGTYNRAQYRAQMAQALARWADHVHSIVSGAPAKVVTLHAA